MADATSAVSPLRRRMIDDMTLRNLSPATQRSYLHAVAKFSRHCHRSPQTSALSLGRTKSGDDTLYVLRRKEKSRITAEARRRSALGRILSPDGDGIGNGGIGLLCFGADTGVRPELL